MYQRNNNNWIIIYSIRWTSRELLYENNNVYTWISFPTIKSFDLSVEIIFNIIRNETLFPKRSTNEWISIDYPAISKIGIRQYREIDNNPSGKSS